MKNQKSVIIIGAGIGGLATAIQLSRAGLKVRIYEKNTIAGGRCGLISRDGYIFDTGPTMYIFPDIYKDFFNSIGENVADYFDLISVDPFYKLFFQNGNNFTFTQNHKKFIRQLNKFEKDGFEKYKQVMKWSEKHYNLAIHTLTKKDYKTFFEYFSIPLLKFLISTRSLESHYRFVSTFFTSDVLRAAFTFQDSYLSLNPFTSPSIYSLFPYNELINGSYLPRGGMHRIIDALESLARKYNVQLFYESPVSYIDTDGNNAKGIFLDNGSYHTADILIANADLTYVYNNLLPPSKEGKNLLKKKYSCSAITFHWALDRKYDELVTHNLFFSDSYKNGFFDVLKGTTPPPEPHFYVQVPTRSDQSRAPKGCDAVTVMIPINHLTNRTLIDWDEYHRQVRTYIISKLEENGLKKLGSHIRFEVSHMQKDWQNHLNLPYGSIYGLDHNLLQLGYLRPHRQHKEYSNLFFVGASTHPGSGLPTVLQSSIFTARDVLSYC